MVISSASMVDRTNQEEVDKYNKLLDKYSSLIDPHSKERKAKEKQGMEDLFNTLFKDGDTPKPIRMKVEE